MNASYDVVGYAYRAAAYCPQDIVAAVCSNVLANPDPETGSWTKRPFDTEAQLRALAWQLGIDPEREETYDSDAFPKVIFRDQADDLACSTCGQRLEER